MAPELGHRIRGPHQGLRAGLPSVCSSCHFPGDFPPHVALLGHGTPPILVSGSKPMGHPSTMMLLLLLFPVHCNLAATKPSKILPIYPFSSSPSGLAKVKPFLFCRSFPPGLPPALISFYLQTILVSPPDSSSDVLVGSHHSSAQKLSRVPTVQATKPKTEYPVIQVPPQSRCLNLSDLALHGPSHLPCSHCHTSASCFRFLPCLDSAQSPAPLLGHHLAQNNISLL